MWLARTAWESSRLYYHCSAERCCCIGDQALLGEVTRTGRERALTALLMRIPLHDPSTPFKGIRAVEGGQAIRIERAEGESSRARISRWLTRWTRSCTPA